MRESLSAAIKRLFRPADQPLCEAIEVLRLVVRVQSRSCRALERRVRRLERVVKRASTR